MADTFDTSPDSDLDYTWDWSRWLPDMDTIDDAEIIITVPGSVESHTTSHTDTTVTTWLRDALPMRTIEVVARITTVQGRVDERPIYLTVGNDIDP